ncbi:MAG: hypothetical protein J6B87_07290 [Clostridia bacterium]|nr:hypothetical protein [Clostridia bacterium]
MIRMTEQRFKETVSTGIVTDTITGKEYNCEYRINDELLELINKIEKENRELKSLCKTLITYIEKNSIAFVIDENIRGLLE